MIRLLVYVFISGLLLIVCRYHYNHPGYNWDMLPYMGVVLEYEQVENIHEQVFSTAENELPKNAFLQLTDTSNAFRSKVYHSVEAFDQQLPFYVVKPLYTRMAQLFYKTGIPLTKATMMPSLLAYFLLSMLLLYWLEKYLPAVIAFIAAFAMAIWGPFLLLSKTSGPDALSALLLSGAMYCILEKRNAWLMYFLLLMSILTRIDNLLPAIFLIAVYVYDSKLVWKQRLKTGSVLLAGCLICYFFVATLATKYGWSNFYYTDFYKHLNPEYDMNVAFNIQNYLALVKSQLMTGVYYSQLPLFFFLSVVIMASRMKVETDTMLIAVIWGVILLRFLLHPVMADRLYMGYYIVILVMLVRVSSGLRQYKKHAWPRAG